MKNLTLLCLVYVFSNMTFDLAKGVITIYFDEYLNASRLTYKDFKITSSNDLATAIVLQLSEYSVVKYDSNQGAIVIDLGLYSRDLELLRGTNGLATSITNSFIAMRNISDLFGNTISGTVVRQALTFFKDVTPVRAESFDFYSHNGNTRIAIHFSKGVLLSTFSCSDFQFASEPSSTASEKVTLTSSDCTVISVTDGSSITFDVTSGKFSTIGTAQSTTYMYITVTGTTTDFFSNPMDTIPIESALRVGGRITKFILDLNIGRFTLIFSRPIDRSGIFHSSKIGFFSEKSKKFYNLTESQETLGALLPT